MLLKIFRQDIDFLNQAMTTFDWPKSPQGLYEPIEYLLSLGGKRIRPVLVLATARLLQGNYDRAIEPALAVELFHNFSLMHDDIMDQAELRRGQATVHTKYNVNTGILSGDMMLIYAYKCLAKLPEQYQSPSFKVFNKMAEEVCIGQQMDMDFEESYTVSVMDYLKMIELKTSVLVGASMQLGAIASKASETDAFHCYEFGKNIGIAFQIQDDILDTFGESHAVGKRIGGDIINNKKTYLYLKSLQLLGNQGKAKLTSLYADKSSEEEQKIKEVKQLFNSSGVRVYADELKNEYRSLALSHLDAITGLSTEAKSEFHHFADYLVKREL